MPYAAVVALLAALYFASAKLGFFAAAAHGVVSSAWPPSGIALAALVLLGVRFWPAVALGAFLAKRRAACRSPAPPLLLRETRWKR